VFRLLKYREAQKTYALVTVGEKVLNISRGCLETYFRCDGMFSDGFITNITQCRPLHSLSAVLLKCNIPFIIIECHRQKPRCTFPCFMCLFNCVPAYLDIIMQQKHFHLME